jgi:hypothetical protein
MEKTPEMPDVEDSRDDGVGRAFRMMVGHELDAARQFDPYVTYGPDLDGSPTTIASRAEGGNAGNAGNGFQSMSSGRTDLKRT